MTINCLPEPVLNARERVSVPGRPQEDAAGLVRARGPRSAGVQLPGEGLRKLQVSFEKTNINLI